MWDSLAHCLRLRPKKNEVESPQDLLLHPELTLAESNHLPLVHSQRCTGFRVSYWFQLWLGRIQVQAEGSALALPGFIALR
jgi:hypothetical protein